MKKLLLIFLFTSGIIPTGLIKSISIFDLYFGIYLIYLLSRYKIDRSKFIFLVTFLTILVLSNNFSLFFNPIHTIDNENFIASMVYTFRLFEMFLFLYILSYIPKSKLQILQQSVYLSIILTFLVSIIYTILVILNIVTDTNAISGTGRFSSFFGNANGYGYFLLYVFITNIYFTSNLIIKNILSFLIVVSILLTASFSSLILLFAVLMSKFSLKKIFKYFFLIFIFISILYLTYDLYSLYLPNRLQDIISFRSVHSVGTYSTRAKVIKLTLELISNNIEYFLMLGLGLGNSNIFPDNGSLVGPHNTFVNLVFMIGIIPTILLLLWFLVVLLNLYKKSSNGNIFFTYLIPFMGYFIFAPIAYLPQVYIPLIMVVANKFKKFENNK